MKEEHKVTSNTNDKNAHEWDATTTSEVKAPHLRFIRVHSGFKFSQTPGNPEQKR